MGRIIGLSYNTDNYRQQGGGNWVINGTLTIGTSGQLIDEGGKWEDLRVPLTAVRVGASKIPGFDDTFGGIKAYSFDAASQEEVHFYVQLPHSWLTGTELRPHIHWTTTASSTTTTKVRWGLEYTRQDAFGTFAATSTSNALSTPSGPLKHEITSFPVISMSTISGPSAMVMMRLYRDSTSALDTYAADASVLEFDLHYQVSTLGTTSEYS